MKRFVFPMLCALALGSSYAVQQDLEKPILKVNGQTLTSQDLELVKAMLPLEQFKTSKGRGKLIDGIYTQFLIQKTLLEQNGMQKVTSREIEDFVKSSKQMVEMPSIYQPTGFAAKTLLNLRYSKHSILGFGEQISNLIEEPNTDRQVLIERKITSWQVSNSRWGSVSARAMLVDSAQQATRLEQELKRGVSFAKLAQDHSLVRASVGGSLSGTERPEFIAIEYLEPELQVAIAAKPNQKFLRVNAPFGRVWLVQVLNVEQIIDSPTGFLALTGDFSRDLSQFTDVIVRSAGNNLFSLNLNQVLINNQNTIEVLSAELPQIDPVVAEVGMAKVNLASAYASAFFTQEVQDFPKLEKEVALQLENWIKAQIIRQGLPLGGAGGEYGLETYLAARANVSETQLKNYYNLTKDKYRIGRAFEASVFACVFQTLKYAQDWQKVISLLPTPNWIDQLFYPLNMCDFEGATDILKYEKPSRANLTPIAGGFVTNIFKLGNEYAFLLLYGYLPKPMLKPFNLVRGEVEREYRRLVAKKQLPAFERNLRQKAGAKNLLEQALKDLEQP